MKAPNDAHAELLVLAHHVANPLHTLVGIHGTLRDETIGMLFQRFAADVPTDADQAHLYAETVHLVQRHRDGIAFAVQLLRHVLEHVFDGEIELGRRILQLLADEVVHFEVVGGEADHRVDYSNTVRADGGHGHDQIPYSAFWNR